MKKNTKHTDTFWKHLTRFSSVFASIPEAVLLIDTKGKIVMANPAIELLTGRVPSDFTGAVVSEMLPLTCAKADVGHLMQEAIAGWSAVEFPDECSIIHTNGNSLPVAAVTTPLYEDDGTYIGIVLVIRDISKDVELKHQQYAFFSFATHQMRQPLAYMRLGLESILTDKAQLSSEHRDMFQELLQVVLKSVKFINEFLDLSRLEQGRIDLVLKSVDMQKLLEEIGKELTGFAVSQNITLRIFPGGIPQEPLIVHSDEERLKDVMRNLITNAISYNRPQGEVRVDASRLLANEAAQRAAGLRGSEDFQSFFKTFTDDKKQVFVPFLMFTVSDTGLGIPAEDQASIFRSFFRASNVKKKGIVGTGLGLSIVKSIIERSGGRIGFESKDGVGTTFYLFFPLENK